MLSCGKFVGAEGGADGDDSGERRVARKESKEVGREGRDAVFSGRPVEVVAEVKRGLMSCRALRIATPRPRPNHSVVPSPVSQPKIQNSHILPLSFALNIRPHKDRQHIIILEPRHINQRLTRKPLARPDLLVGCICALLVRLEDFDLAGLAVWEYQIQIAVLVDR